MEQDSEILILTKQVAFYDGALVAFDFFKSKNIDCTGLYEYVKEFLNKNEGYKLP